MCRAVSGPPAKSQYNLPMRFARRVFLVAAIYGSVVTTPMFFLERRIGIDSPPPITHPEFYYGFASLVIAWQVMFVLVASDPIRYRPVMLVGIIEKLSFAIPVPILFAMGRVSSGILAFSMIDAAWAVLFAISYWKTQPPRTASWTASPAQEH